MCRIETGEREKGNCDGATGRHFSSSHHPPRSEVFNYCFFFLSKYPTEASSEERVAEVTLQEVKDDLNMILFVI